MAWTRLPERSPTRDCPVIARLLGVEPRLTILETVVLPYHFRRKEGLPGRACTRHKGFPPSLQPYLPMALVTHE